MGRDRKKKRGEVYRDRRGGMEKERERRRRNMGRKGEEEEKKGSVKERREV